MFFLWGIRCCPTPIHHEPLKYSLHVVSLRRTDGVGAASSYSGNVSILYVAVLHLIDS